MLHTVVFRRCIRSTQSDTYRTIAKAVPMVGAAVTSLLRTQRLNTRDAAPPGDTPLRAFIWRRVKKIDLSDASGGRGHALLVPPGKLVTWLPTTALVQT